ncbi:hypothetical protein JOM56_003244 [Amanita muscaria]
MGQVIKNINNLARTKRPIAGRRLNNFEGRQVLPTTGFQITSTSSTVTTPSLTTTSSTTTNTPSTNPPLTDSTSIVTTTVSSTSTMIPTPAPSQTHDYRIPLIVVVCISGVFILTAAIVFIIRHLHKTWQVQTGEARSTIFGIRIPQPRPVIGGTPHEQQSSSSEKVDCSLPKPVAMGQHAQRDQQPVSILPPQQRQQSSSQVGHLQRQLVHAVGAQDLSDHEEPPGYVP